MSNKFPVYSVATLNDFIAMIYDIYGSGNYITFSWTIGRQATMPQKALLNIWIRTYAAHLIRKPSKDVTKTEITTMKRASKNQFYSETHEDWMVEEISDPFHPDRKRLEVTSTADWNPQQCYHFMMWLQDKAMNDGLILESKGEHQKMTHESVGK